MPTNATNIQQPSCFPALCLVLGLAFLLGSCSTEGQSGNLTSSPEPGFQLQQRAIMNLLGLYSEALMQEDIDRLQKLLPPPEGFSSPAPCQQQNTLTQETSGSFIDAQAFRQMLTSAFCTRAFTHVDIPPETVHIAPDNRSVSFLEVVTVENFFLPAQQTAVFRTTFQVALDAEVNNGPVVVRITAVRRQGPLFQITLHGQIVAGIPARLEVGAVDETLTITAVEVTVPETAEVQQLVSTEARFVGAFTPPMRRTPQPLRVRIADDTGAETMVNHPYRLRLPGDPVVQEIPGIGAGFLAEAVVLAPDGTVWIGGREPPFGGGTLYYIPPGSIEALFFGDLFPAQSDAPLPPEEFIRVTDLVFDDLGRFHVLVSGTPAMSAPVNGDFVSEPLFDPFCCCQTVNINDPGYPFHVRNPQTGEVLASHSTRAAAADTGDIWLFGSSDGVARVHDNFRQGACPDNAVEVVYDPLFRREDSELLSNTVPALVVGTDGALWFGTALGLTRWREGQFTPALFHRNLTLQGDVATLEAFFQEVAAAIFEARPLTTIGIGDVSFPTLFGAELVKEDLIFSAVEDHAGRLWVGTLGGGIRRLEVNSDRVQDTLHLTRQDGLGSNVIFALAAGEEGTIWAATDEGVSRIQDNDGTVSIMNFSALDGQLSVRVPNLNDVPEANEPVLLQGPVRDIAVDDQGILWMATDIGVFRIFAPGGTVQGTVQDGLGNPVTGADVVLLETVFHLQTPFRTVTNAMGHYTLANVPPGLFRLRIDGSLAAGGPLSSVEQDVTIQPGEQSLEDIVLMPQ